MPKLYKIIYQVKSNTQYISFPIDMLRYDTSIPYSPSDAQMITQSIVSKITPNPTLSNESIRLIHYSHGNKNWKPRIDRWDSFGYQVISINPPIAF